MDHGSSVEEEKRAGRVFPSVCLTWHGLLVSVKMSWLPPRPTLFGQSLIKAVLLLLLQFIISVSLGFWGVNTRSDHRRIVFAPCRLLTFLSVSNLFGSVTDQLKSLGFHFLCEQADPLYTKQAGIIFLLYFRQSSQCVFSCSFDVI